ncbi:MAG: hypothetical protein U9O55_04040 [Patescibacteria group bacterium]|nr:hypothetical protein [Patescibacteria group bacterium]
MKKIIFLSFLSMALVIPYSANAGCGCGLPGNLPAPPPKYEKVWNQAAQKLDGFNRDLLKLWKCPTAYPYLLLGGKKGYMLFYPIKQYGRNTHKSCMWVAGFIYKNNIWRLHEMYYLNGNLEDRFPGLYLSIIMSENYDWDEP